MKKSFFPCRKILPLVYDESLSYYEVLCKLAKRMDELEEELAKKSRNLFIHMIETGSQSNWNRFYLVLPIEEELSSFSTIREKCENFSYMGSGLAGTLLGTNAVQYCFYVNAQDVLKCDAYLRDGTTVSLSPESMTITSDTVMVFEEE